MNMLSLGASYTGSSQIVELTFHETPFNHMVMGTQVL